MRINDKHPQFTGTTYYYNIGMGQNVVCTDGVMYIAEQYRAFWLLSAIVSHLGSVKNEEFIVILLDHAPKGDNKDRFVLSIQDDIPPQKMFAKQEIPFNDSSKSVQN